MAAVAAAAAASTKKVDGVLPALRVPSTDAKFGGGGGFVEPFLERMQELTALGSQIGSTGIITEAVSVTRMPRDSIHASFFSF